MQRAAPDDMEPAVTALDSRPVHTLDASLARVRDPQDRAELASGMRQEIARRSRAAAAFWDALIVRCPGCAQALPSSAFARTASRPNGLQWCCRSCSAVVAAKKRRARATRLACPVTPTTPTPKDAR